MRKNTFFGKNKFILIAIFLFALDFGVTWYLINFGPGGLDEGNPLFEIDGGYLALVVNFLYLSLVFGLEKLVFNKYQTVVLDASGSFEYTKKIFKSDKTDFVVVSIVFAFVLSTFLSRAMAIIDWVVYGFYKGEFHKTKYAILRSKMPFGRYDSLIAVISLIVFYVLWFHIEYRRSQKLLKIEL
ncbi:MAG: hypothetical protein WC225_04905 [Acholeplasmataceae bacterium]|nr:hypothetical protein [Acholeplasmataceae bacterium]